MSRPVRLLVITAALVTVLPACTSAPSSSTGPSAGPGSSGTAGPTASATPSTPAPLQPGDSVTFAIASGSAGLNILGSYPAPVTKCVHPRQPVLDASYPGAVTVSRESGGTLAVSVRVPFETYLLGIAEVPASWPTAALEAQAVAARSYALAQIGWTGAPGETVTQPICASTACQVYAGLSVVQGADGGRWRDAVQRTAGKVLLYGGRPADTVYFSTSNGTTVGNDQVFGSAPLPYLRPVVERDDAASPESHWHVRIPFADLARFLSAAGDRPAGLPIGSVRRAGGTIVVKGGGKVTRLDILSFQHDVNDQARCLLPDSYPTPSSTGGSLPTTLPSRWFSVGTKGGGAVFAGRGWGHGVGMVQWGARGKALKGWSYAKILGYYYGGLQPKSFSEPGEIRVDVATGLTSVTVDGGGAAVTIDGKLAGPGPWVIAGG